MEQITSMVLCFEFEKVYFVSSAERRILTQERVATRAEVPRVISAFVAIRSRP